MSNYTYPTSSNVTNPYEGDFAANIFSINSPTDQTESIPTTGTSGTFTEVTVTSVTSTIDPTITNLGYRRVHDNGHAATAKLMPFILLGGYGQNGISQFPDSMAERMASYVDPITARAPLVIKAQQRGRGNLGTIDYARDAYDLADILDHAVSAVGSNAYGYGTTGGASAVVVGYSTGGLDALNFASRFPDRTLGVVVYYPNYDIGYDSDSYYFKKDNLRSSIAASVQPGGDTRLSAGAANLDQYMARNAIDAIARIVAIPGGPHVWLIGDYDETGDGLTLPSIARLQNALQAIPAAKGKVHVHISQTGDSTRYLHDDGSNSANAQYAERFYFPYLLKNASEWTMPRRSPPGDLRLLGFMKTKLFEVWTGPSTAPKTAASAGGKDHACEFSYDDYTRRFTVLPLTTTSGYFQVLRDADNLSTAFTANTKLTVDLNVTRSISAVTDIGVTHSFRADLGVTSSGGLVSAWADQIGALSFTEATNKPTLTTDAQSKSLIRFTSGSSTKLVLSSLLVTPTSDFTIFCVMSRSTTNNERWFEMSHHGTFARIGMGSSASTTLAEVFNNDGSWAIANTNGIGAQTISGNTKHLIALMRKSGYLYISIDGSSWSKSSYGTEAFTQTGTNTTSLGCGWADGGGAYWKFFSGDIYEIDSKQGATSEVDVFAIYQLMKTRWSF